MKVPDLFSGELLLLSEVDSQSELLLVKYIILLGIIPSELV